MSYSIITGRVEDVLPTLVDNTFDGVLCDPPYGLNSANTDRAIACLTRWLAGEPYHPGGGGFMGKPWDAWTPGPEVWREVCRVIKPGAHVLAFGGTRMSDFLSIALRLGGLEIRDEISYLYDGNPLASPVLWVQGSGFPKSHDIGKALDKAAGAEREVVGTYRAAQQTNNCGTSFNSSKADSKGVTYATLTAPATPAARQWDGYGTALKPAHEPCIVAMKPCDGTYAANALAWGVAGINVDGCRVGIDVEEALKSKDFRTTAGNRHIPLETPPGEYETVEEKRTVENHHPLSLRHNAAGRWPSNVITDGSPEVVGLFPVTSSGSGKPRIERTGDSTKSKTGGLGIEGGRPVGFETPQYPDSGSAARFFYAAKASKRERDAGLEGFAEVAAQSTGWSGESMPLRQDGTERKMPIVRNHHPTVKPLALCEYLARLILPPERATPRRLLVVFAGSGSEMIGALQAGWDEVVGIELDPEYVAIAEARLAHWTGQGIQHPLFSQRTEVTV